MKQGWHQLMFNYLLLLYDPPVSPMTIDTILLSIKILENIDSKKFGSIIFLHNGHKEIFETHNFYQSDYHKLLISTFSGNIEFRCSHDMNYTQKIEKILKEQWQTLMVVLDFETCTVLKQALLDLPKEDFRANTWLFVNPYENVSEVNESHFKRVMSNKLLLDSQMYVLNGNKNHALLHELYKICSEREVKMVELKKICHGAELLCMDQTNAVKEKNLEEKRRLWDRRNDLMGCNLRVAYVEDANYIKMAKTEKEVEHLDQRHVFKSGNTTMYSGVGNELELIKELSGDLNFSITWIKADDNSYGILNKTTKTWDGLIGLIVSDKADLSNAYLAVMKTRSEAISFTVDFDHTQFGLFRARPSVILSWFTFVEVFSLTYWCALISAFVIFSLVLIFFFYSIRKNYCTTAKIFHGYIKSSFAAVLLSLATYDVFDEKIRQLYHRNSFKILIFVICLVGWLNKEVYNGGLISSLINRHHEFKINSLEDILVNPGYQLVLTKGTASVQYFENSEQWPTKQIWNSQLKNQPNAYVESTPHAETLLLNEEKVVYFGLTSSVELAFESYPCLISRSQNTYFHRSVSLPFQKNSPYLGLFNHKLRIYKESGVLANMVSMRKNPKGINSCPSHQSYSFGYDAVVSAFVALTMGLMFSILYLLFEILQKKYSGRKRLVIEMLDN